MSASLPVIKGNPSGSALVLPRWQAYQLQRRGLYIGHRILFNYGQNFYLDLAKLRYRDASGNEGIGNVNFIVTGDQHSGKSTLAKCVANRFSGIQNFDQALGSPVPTRILAEDHRHEGGTNEMRPLTNTFHGRTISSRDLHGINPLIGLNDTQILELSIRIGEITLGRKLTEFERQVTQVVVGLMWNNRASRNVPPPEDGNVVTLPEDLKSVSPVELAKRFATTTKEDLLADDRHLFKIPKNEVGGAKRIEYDNNVSEQAYREAAGHLYAAFSQVIGKVYGRMLGDSISYQELMAGQFVTIDWLGINQNALDLMQMLMWQSQRYRLVNDQVNQVPHIHIADELHRTINNPVAAEALEQSINTSRTESTINILSTQYLSQIVYAGEEGSRTRGAARNILKGIAGFFIGHPSDQDQESLNSFREIGITNEEIEVIQVLGVGEFAFKLPGRPAIFFKLDVLPCEWDAIETDSSLHRIIDSRRPVTDFDPLTGQLRPEFLEPGSVLIDEPPLNDSPIEQIVGPLSNGQTPASVR